MSSIPVEKLDVSQTQSQNIEERFFGAGIQKKTAESVRRVFDGYRPASVLYVPRFTPGS
jgi:hypothetical protein